MQSALDGFAVIILAWLLSQLVIGAFTESYMILLLVLLGMMAVLYDYFNVYRGNQKLADNFFKLFKAWSAAFIGLILLGFLTKESGAYSRLYVGTLYFSGFVLQALLHFIVRSIQLSILSNPLNRENVLIVGQGRLAEYLSQRIINNVWLGQKVVGAIKFDSIASISPDNIPPSNVPLLGDIKDLPDVIQRYDVKTVYIVTPLESSVVAKEAYSELLGKNVAVHWVPDIYALRLVNHSFTEVAGLPVLTFSETPLMGINRFAKTIEDFVLASLILILILPVLAVVAIAVKLDSPGPIFFRQSRAGWNGKTFRIWKFRSMHIHQEDPGVIKQAQKNDPRITKVGAFIRKTSLDELPQVFNVLTGDMSLVGPRPHAIQHDQEYSKRIDDYFARHQIKPGITGLAQVRGLRGETTDVESMAQRVESDIEYINNWSVWLDIVILFRTIFAFTGKNAY